MTIDTAALAAELATIADRRKQLEDREKQIKAELRALGEGKHPAGNLTLTLYRRNMLDEDKVRATYPQADWPHFYVAKLATTVIKGSVPPLMYEQLSTPSGELIVKVS